MQRRQSFSQFLIGTASLERPSFFYAYSGMWLHLLLSVPLLIFVFHVTLVDALTTMAISSFSLGAVIYSILSKEYGLLVNLLPYSLSLARALDPTLVGYSFLVLTIFIGIASGYFLLANEYRRFTREVYDGDESGVPLSITVTIGCTLILLFLYGVHLLQP